MSSLIWKRTRLRSVQVWIGVLPHGCGSMWSVDLILRAILSALIIFGGIQDWKCGEVANWITIPLLVAGLIACAIKLLNDPETGLGLTMLIILLTILAWNRWMGGADWKVLVGLFGLWPAAGFAAILDAGLWGIVEMIRKLN